MPGEDDTLFALSKHFKPAAKFSFQATWKTFSTSQKK